jgi:pimeloyl-ACP methyl ester carboxylesterase
VRIRFVEEGAGEPVVLLHGFAGSLTNAWRGTGVLADLSKDHRVVAMDLRGHGRSGKPHSADAYGDEMVQDVVRLMDHLKMPRAHVVGYSLGGAVAAKLAENQVRACSLAH